MRKGLIIFSLLVSGCVSLFKQFERVEDDPTKWCKEVEAVMAPLQGKYLTAIYDANFKLTDKDLGFQIKANELVRYTEKESIRIKEIRYERDFIDYIGNNVRLFIFKDSKKQKYQLYFFTTGRLEIISPGRWDVYKRKEKI